MLTASQHKTTMMMRLLLLQTVLFISISSYSQKFLNGDFENTTATTDLINLSNNDVEKHLPHVTSFGSYGDVDIISSASYAGSGAQSKQWYIALTGGSTDVIALELSAELIEGKQYSISFYDRKQNSYSASAFQVGLSATNKSFGTVIYTSPNGPVSDVWTNRVFTFTAPKNGKYITVQMPEGSISTWAHIDNFTFTNVTCPKKITIEASQLVIEKGQTIILTASGANEFDWTKNELLQNYNSNSVLATPTVNTTYIVFSKQENCPVLTATVAIKVNEPIKKNTVIKPKLAHKTFSRKKLNGRKLIIQEKLTTSENTISICIYDKNRLDGDVVSIYINGELVKENITVTKTKYEFTITLQEGSNLIVMEAINLGTVPPNTAGISITEKDKKAKLITLISDLKKSGTLEIIYQPESVALN